MWMGPSESSGPSETETWFPLCVAMLAPTHLPNIRRSLVVQARALGPLKPCDHSQGMAGTENKWGGAGSTAHPT